MSYIEYDTATGVIVENFKTRSEMAMNPDGTINVIDIDREMLFDPPPPYSLNWAKDIFCDVVQQVYSEAVGIAIKYKHAVVSPLALFIALWEKDKDVISSFLHALGLNVDGIMNEISLAFNRESRYFRDFQYSPMYSNYKNEAEIAKNLANQMYLKRANSLCIIWSFIIHNNEFGQILCNHKHLTNKDIHEAFVYALSKHMRCYLKNIDECKKWPLFSEMYLLEFGEDDIQNSHIDVGSIIQRRHSKDLTDYIHSVTTRTFGILCEAKKMCRERKYKSITPHVIFAAMTVSEKDFLSKVFSEYEVDINDICRKCEQEMEKLQVDDDETEGELSESVQELLSLAMEEDRLSPNGIINIDSLLFVIILCSEMSSVFEDTVVNFNDSNNDLSWSVYDVVNDEDLYLEYDPNSDFFLMRIKNIFDEVKSSPSDFRFDGFEFDEKTGAFVYMKS